MRIGSRGATKRGRVFVAALACLAGGCATVDDGRYGVPVDAANRPQSAAAPQPLMVSASEAGSYSTTYMGLVEVTFENRTSVWKQVDHVAVDFGSPAKNQSVTIASADDIDVWERALALSSAVTRWPLAATGIEALGLDAGDTLGAWAGHRRRASTAGAGGAPDVAALEPSAVPTTSSYPDQHLLTTPIRIPPGLFTKRWILLTTPANPPGGCIDSMILSYETSDHATGRVSLTFKIRGTAWQGPACPISTIDYNRSLPMN